MRSCPEYRYGPASSVLLGGKSAGHGPVQMAEKFVEGFEVPCVVSVSHFSSVRFVLLFPTALVSQELCPCPMESGAFKYEVVPGRGPT